MCDCCDDFYCDGCGNCGDIPASEQPMFGVTPYLTLTSTTSGTGTSTLVTLAEAKQQCRVDIDDDDALIQTYIDAAIAYVEGRTGSSLRLTKHVVEYHDFPDGKDVLVLPVPGLDVTQFADIKIDYVDTSGNFQTMEFGVDFDSIPSQPQSVIYPTSTATGWPDALTSTDETPSNIGYHIPPTVTYFTSPTSAIKTPAEAKVATLMLVAHWYTAREPVTTGLTASNNKVPYTVDILLASSSDNITF